MKYLPRDEGVTHINIYTKSSSQLGRLLSNLSDIPIYHPVHRHFRTLEGFWMFMSTGMTNYEFTILDGYAARKLGKATERVMVDPEFFRKQIKLAMISKVERSIQLGQLLIESELPFTHYYVYGINSPEPRQIFPESGMWQVEYWNLMREELKRHGSDALELLRNKLQ